MTFTTRGRLAAVVLTTSLVLAGTAACGRGDTDGGGSGEGSGKSVTLSLSTLNNPFFVDVRDGAQEAADELGIDLTVVDAQNDSTAQTDQIASAVSSGTEGLLINAVDSDAAALMHSVSLVTNATGFVST